jgi:ATP-binding cassette subfamily F protein 3
LTTHVDAPTIQALALALKTYAGGIVLITHDRWFSRVVIEGESHRPSAPDESSDDDSSDEEEGRRGKTYKVGGGKVKQLEKGMGGYVAFVERKLERERKKRELELAANV